MQYKFIKKGQVDADPKKMYRVLDVDGNLINSKYKTKLTNKQLLEGYEFMVLSRQQDSYMSQLQRQGRMLTFAPNFGEEALQVATSLAFKKGDWFIPAFRSNATMLHLGVPLVNQMIYWNGNENGSKMPEGVNVLPMNVPIATQCSHAAGIAYAMKLKNQKNVSVSFIGNGGTAEGEFYEAMNMASIHNWPTVFCVNNNQWSISTPEELESASSTIAAKAVSTGMPGVRVDGNDLLASYEVINEAMDYARELNGPVLVEFVTWRQGPHTTSDNPRIYRTEKQEKDAEKWEPFHRIEKYLIDKKILTEKKKDKIWEDKLNEVKEAFKESLKATATLDDIFDHTYETLTEELAEQKEEAMEIFLKGGSNA